MTAKPQYDGRLYSQAEVDRLVIEARIEILKSVRRTYKKKDGRANDLSKMTRAELDNKITVLSQTLKEHKE